MDFSWLLNFFVTSSTTLVPKSAQFKGLMYYEMYNFKILQAGNELYKNILYTSSFLITISHFLLYVPTMLVIGLHGWFLHPIAILLCDMIVYSEFLIHPVVLLSTSTKLRTEVKHTLKVLFSQVQETLTLYLPTNLQYSHYL